MICISDYRDRVDLTQSLMKHINWNTYICDRADVVLQEVFNTVTNSYDKMFNKEVWFFNLIVCF